MSLSYDYLEEIWTSITLDEHTKYDYKRIDGLCIPDLCLGLNSEGYRCLILELPRENTVDFQPVVRKNITLKLHNNCIVVLELRASGFDNLFNDLVVSLYQGIKDISNYEEYASIFISTFHKWSEFFNNLDFYRLTEGEIKGLIGELLVLRYFLLKCNSVDINTLLRSWKGPYDKGKDFEMDQKDIEVKSKNLNKLSVKISSEHQLDPVQFKGLELWVVSLIPSTDDGVTLSDLIYEVQELVVRGLGDVSILRKALWQKGLTLENTSEYDNYKYRPRSISTYDTTEKDFPLLNSTNLNPALTRVKYELNLGLIDKFLLEEIRL